MIKNTISLAINVNVVFMAYYVNLSKPAISTMALVDKCSLSVEYT